MSNAPQRVTKYLTIVVVMLFAACGQRKERLNILVYPEFLDPSIISEFEKQS
jgi:hypothetical protein